MPFNCLTDNDKELINSYIGKYALSYSDNPNTRRCEDMEYVLRLWDYAKKSHLFKLFGNQLILEKQIRFTKSPNELQDDIYEAFVQNDIFKRFAEFIAIEYDVFHHIAPKLAILLKARLLRLHIILVDLRSKNIVEQFLDEIIVGLFLDSSC